MLKCSHNLAYKMNVGRVYEKSQNAEDFGYIHIHLLLNLKSNHTLVCDSHLYKKSQHAENFVVLVILVIPLRYIKHML